MASRELEIKAPRPVCETMPNAVRTAILHENTLADINLSKWAESYRCGVEEIRLEWERQLSITSQEPSNQYETPEGK